MDIKKIIIIIFFAGMGGMLYGYDIGVLNAALLFIHNDISMTTFQTSLMGGAVLFGGAFAILVCGVLADWFGRRRMITAASAIFIISVWLIYISQTYEMLLISRLIQGVAVGFISITIPLYLTETMPASIRGMAVTAFQLFLTAGILIANLVGFSLSDSGNWRDMFLIAIIPALLVFIGSFFLVKSPRWLIYKHRPDEAKKVMESLMSKEEMKKTTDADKANGQLENTHNMRLSKYLKPLALVCAIAILNQLSGINSILQFSATLFKEIGYTQNSAAIFDGVLITLVNFVTTIIAMLIVDKLERKKILSYSTGLMAIVLVVTGILLYLLPFGQAKGIALLIGLLLFILFFAIGPGALIWVILSELLPTHIRSKGLALALFLNSMASAIFASIFLPITQGLGAGSIFIICGICMVLYCWTVAAYVPKTSGLSLEDIEQQMTK